jgi:signal transduction histidine kinase
MFMAVFVFYKTKLKKPLFILEKASERITNHDLDFTVDYKSQDEMGRLCSSFDEMRFSLLQNSRLMQKQMEQRKRLNAAFAHDLRTPLTVLKGYAEILQLKSGSTAKETAVTMSKHINRLERYVDSMSSLQRMEDIVPDYKQTNLSELISHNQQTVNIIFEKSDKTCQFRYQIISDTAMLDVEIFSQVFENLVSNAIRYATKSVDIDIFEMGNIIGIAVSDDGEGFSADGLENAAEPYYTGSDRTSEHFGLGLYICKLLCEHHGGNIEVRNTDSGAKITARFKKYFAQ